MSLVAKIEAYAVDQYPNWFHKGNLGRKAVLEWGCLTDTVGRELRKMAENKMLEVKSDEKKSRSVLYRAAPLLLKKRNWTNKIPVSYRDKYAN